MIVALFVLACCTCIAAFFTSVLASQYGANPRVEYHGLTAWAGLSALLGTATVVLGTIALATGAR